METRLDGTDGCQPFHVLLLRSWDGELAPFEAELLARHLEGCASCLEQRDGYGEVRALLGAWAEETLAPVLGERSAPTSVTSWGARFELTAAVLLIGLSLWWALTHRVDPEQPPTEGIVQTSTVAPAVIAIGEDVLCVTMPTESPDVHAVWIYPLSETISLTPTGEIR